MRAICIFSYSQLGLFIETCFRIIFNTHEISVTGTRNSQMMLTAHPSAVGTAVVEIAAAVGAAVAEIAAAVLVGAAEAAVLLRFALFAHAVLGLVPWTKCHQNLLHYLTQTHRS